MKNAERWKCKECIKSGIDPKTNQADICIGVKYSLDAEYIESMDSCPKMCKRCGGRGEIEKTPIPSDNGCQAPWLDVCPICRGKKMK